mmetsp:Transcript_37567/g.50854  ORF Transcript_37567/g.50854 Transcript_37567/m.50854 type:complete len:256 (-) Transcript_37567:93-860(-)
MRNQTKSAALLPRRYVRPGSSCLPLTRWTRSENTLKVIPHMMNFSRSSGLVTLDGGLTARQEKKIWSQRSTSRTSVSAGKGSRMNLRNGFESSVTGVASSSSKGAHHAEATSPGWIFSVGRGWPSRCPNMKTLMTIFFFFPPLFIILSSSWPKRSKPPPMTSRPTSSRVSLTAASRSLSPASRFPPGRAMSPDHLSCGLSARRMRRSSVAAFSLSRRTTLTAARRTPASGVNTFTPHAISRPLVHPNTFTGVALN